MLQRLGLWGGVPWFAGIVAISAFLLAVTFLSYVARGNEVVSSALFWLGLSAQNNVGDWWSGMLAALAAMMAFDGHFDVYKPWRERRGWCALGFALLLISVSEVASLHRYLDSRNDGSIVILGIVGLTLAGYAMMQFHRTALPSRPFSLLLLGFGLLALVPFLELRIRDPVLYGLRVFLEEGIEVAALLIFILAVRDNSMHLQRAAKNMFAVAAKRRRALIWTSLVLWPIATAATLVLPSPGAAANWLAAILLLICALLAVRAAASASRIGVHHVLPIAFYVAASAAANAVRVEWSVTVFSTPVSVRGFVLALFLVGAATLLPANGRPIRALHALLMAGAVACGAAAWPTSHLLWCALPPLFALWLYSIESQALGPAMKPNVLLAAHNAQLPVP